MRVSRAHRAWGLLVVSVAVGVGLGFGLGDGDLDDSSLRGTLLWLRTWRMSSALLAGASLAVAGVLVQGLFRNPLASPSILGTTAGASLGGTAVLLLWNVLLASAAPAWMPAEMLLPVGCLLGALVALLLLLAVTGRRSGVVAVLLSGFILTSFFLSIAGLMSSLAMENWELGRAVIAFTLGGVEAKGPRHLALALPLVVVATLVSLQWSRNLDLMLSGEDEAAVLGVDTAAVRRWVIIWTAVLTAAAVSLSGGISFVGLVVPHALRPWVGAEHRHLLPASLVGGASFVLWADLLTRALPTRGELPLGVVTGLIGAPVFLTLLSRAQRQGRLA